MTMLCAYAPSARATQASEDFLQFSALNLVLLGNPGGEIGDLSPLPTFNDIHRKKDTDSLKYEPIKLS